MSGATVAAAVAALADEAAPVEVVGDGRIAAALRERLGARATGGAARPAAIIETTGDAQALREALRHVEDLGTIVLAGPAPHAAVAVDLYADLHVRGISLAGVPGADAGGP